MNTKPQYQTAMRGFLPLSALITLITFIALLAAPKMQAASQTWTNAPASAEWTNVLNWNSRAIPGALGIAGGGQNADMVTFTNPLAGGIGGTANPIVNETNREVNGFIFDGANCGAYVIGNINSNLLWLSATLLPGGYILMNPAVVNPQIFNAQIHFRLQSSQNGGYNITNNATSAAATLYFDTLWPDTASSRPLTLTLAGSNTGTNTIRHIDDNAGANGSIHLIKTDSGRWILSGANDIPQKTSGGDSVPGSIAVIAGTLEVQDPGSLGAITAVNLSVSNGVLQVDGVTLNSAGITLRNGGTIRMNGSATVNGVTMSALTGNSATLATTTATDVMTVGNAGNTLTGGAIDSVLHVAGPGTVLLSQQNNYAGKWSIDSGTNQLTSQGGLGSGPNLNLNAGAVFDVTPIGAPTTYTLDTKALSANGTGTAVGSTAATILADATSTIDFVSKPLALTFTPTSFVTSDTGHPALLCARGTLSFHGNAITVNNASGTALGAGTYQLVHQAVGNILSSGAFVTVVTGSGLGAGLIAEIVASGGDLNLVVTSYTPKSLVWKGGDVTLPNTWDRQTSINWLAGATPSTFNIYDSVAFNATGSAQPIVNLASTMVPNSVTVDTSANDYTFSGPGQIAGGTALVKLNTAGTLNLQTANTYSGGTIISNGVVKLGIDEGISSTGAGDVALYSPAVFDLNNFTNTVNGLNGNGTVDITGGGSSTLVVGANGNSGVFSGVLRNTSGSLGFAKEGTGIQTLTASNNYSGPTIIDVGTLRVTNQYALGGGNSPVTITSGTLDVNTSLIVSNLNSSGGAVINSSATTNIITVLSGSTNNGVISGKLGILVSAGIFRVNAGNAYSNATVLASGATLAFGNIGQVGPSGVIASNGATLSIPTVTSTPQIPAVAANVTTVDGATVTFTSASTGNSYNGQYTGSTSATNIFSGGNVSIGGAYTFSNFLGTVIITNGTARMFNAVGGGDNTTFIFTNGGGMFTRDASTIRLGALFGNGLITGPSVSFPGSYWIGAKGIDSEYSGTISGSNNVVKVGPARLTLDGAVITTNTDSATYTNYLYASGLTYLNSTTISNGVLAISVPNDLTTSPTITLAGANAVLDAANMGYVSNFTDVNSNPNSSLVTNGILTIVNTTPNGTPQTLAGTGTIKGKGVICNGIINPGIGFGNGTLSISNGLTINGGSTLFMDMSDDLTGLVKANDLIKVQGNVTLAGSTTVTIGGTLKVGTYSLIKYSGSLINESGVVPTGPVSNFILGGQLSRASLLITNVPGEVDLIVVSLNAQNLTWTGDSISNWWDVVSSYSWTNNLTPMQFYQLDNVFFDNTPTTNLTAILQGTLFPNSITYNSSSNYTLGGFGSISGIGTLLKNGTGTLILTNGANTYSGGTVLSNGVLNVGSDSGGNQNDQALGAGLVTVNAGGELRFGGNTGTTVVNHFITNAITLNGGIVKAQDGSQHLTNSVVTVAAGGGTFQTVFATKTLVLDSALSGSGALTIGVPAGFVGSSVILNNPNNTFNGGVTMATNGLLALVGSAGLSNSVSIEVQQGGTLDASARSNAAWSVTAGQTLRGIGTVRGKFVTTLTGSALSPGAAGTIGTLTVTNFGNTTNFVTVTHGGTLAMDINRSATPNADRLVDGTNVFGGTLTVNNLGGALVAGDSFTLFTSITNLGTFTVTNLPTLTSGLGWSNSLALNGKLTVVTTINTARTNIIATVNGNILTLAWPTDHTGWYLQLQTNTTATGLYTNWVTLPGSQLVNTTNMTINPANGAVFYRMSLTP